MRSLSKLAILGLVTAAIGGELFAPPVPPKSKATIERDEFIERSKATVGRAWTHQEISDFNTTHLIPDEIKSKLTTVQIDEFFKDLEDALKEYRAALGS